MSARARPFLLLSLGLASLGLVWLGAWCGLGKVVAPGVLGGQGPDAVGSLPVADVRIAAGGRQALDLAAFSGEPMVRIALEIEDPARGEGLRSARVVSVDGRRLDTVVTPLPGAGTGVELGVDREFLLPGRYLIEVDTVAQSPLRLQRFVLEVE